MNRIRTSLTVLLTIQGIGAAAILAWWYSPIPRLLVDHDTGSIGLLLTVMLFLGVMGSLGPFARKYRLRALLAGILLRLPLIHRFGAALWREEITVMTTVDPIHGWMIASVPASRRYLQPDLQRLRNADHPRLRAAGFVALSRMGRMPLRLLSPSA